MVDKVNIRHVSAAVLLSVFDDLADTARTKYVYASFFDSDYCAALFELAGIVYDKNVINARIAQRPPVPEGIDKGTYTQRISLYDHFAKQRRVYTFCVDSGYITCIESAKKLYRLRQFDSKGQEKECSYIAEIAFERLRAGIYHLCEGV